MSKYTTGREAPFRVRRRAILAEVLLLSFFALLLVLRQEPTLVVQPTVRIQLPAAIRMMATGSDRRGTYLALLCDDQQIRALSCLNGRWTTQDLAWPWAPSPGGEDLILIDIDQDGLLDLGACRFVHSEDSIATVLYLQRNGVFQPTGAGHLGAGVIPLNQGPVSVVRQAASYLVGDAGGGTVDRSRVRTASGAAVQLISGLPVQALDLNADAEQELLTVAIEGAAAEHSRYRLFTWRGSHLSEVWSTDVKQPAALLANDEGYGMGQSRGTAVVDADGDGLDDLLLVEPEFGRVTVYSWRPSAPSDSRGRRS